MYVNEPTDNSKHCKPYMYATVAIVHFKRLGSRHIHKEIEIS